VSFGVAACGLSTTGTTPTGSASDAGPGPVPSPVDATGPAREADAAAPDGGCVDRALVFDGDALVEVSDDRGLDLASPYTVEAWIRPDQALAEMNIVSHHDQDANEGWVLSLKGGRVEARAYGRNGANQAKQVTAGSSGPAYVAAETWAHVAFVLDGDKLAVFYGGSRRSLVTITDFTARNTRRPLVIGRAAYTSNFGFFGAIDEVRISRTARYDVNVTNVIGPTGPFARDAATVALWHFDETNGPKASNDGDGKLDGTLGAANLSPSRAEAFCLPNR